MTGDDFKFHIRTALEHLECGRTEAARDQLVYALAWFNSEDKARAEAEAIGIASHFAAPECVLATHNGELVLVKRQR